MTPQYDIITELPHAGPQNPQKSGEQDLEN